MKAKTITANVLECLLNVIEEFGDLATSRKAAYRHLYMIDREYGWTRTKLGKWINNLRHDGYIQVVSTKAGKSIELTGKGKIKIAESIAANIKSDNIIRYISFDIPNELRKQRDAFRRAIKSMGFKQVQQSLWAINKDVGELVQLAQYEFGVEKYVAYIVSSRSDIDGIVNKILE